MVSYRKVSKVERPSLLSNLAPFRYCYFRGLASFRELWVMVSYRKVSKVTAFVTFEFGFLPLQYLPAYKNLYLRTC